MKNDFLDTLTGRLGLRKLFGWQVRQVSGTSRQSFLAQEEEECRRTVERTLYTVTVYDKREKDVLGFSTFKLSASEGPALDKKLEEALFAARLVSNQIFELPEPPASLPSVDICDATLGNASLQLCKNRVLEAVSREKDTRLSAAEFFIDRLHSRLLNHRGLDAEEEETFLHTEFILLSQSNDRENEFIDRYTRRYMHDFDIEGEVARSAQLARDATRATLPKTGAFPVLLSDEPLDQLFNPILARASARLKYNRMIQTDRGKTVVEEGTVKGDRLTLWSNSLLKGAVGSHRFDSYGTPGQKICLVKDNILKEFLADKRYADYLGLPPTGELGNVEVAGGTTHYEKLLDPAGGTLYHLQAFSAFEPNPITGAFSAEIRAGFEITPKGVRPIKGGSVSGVLQRNLRDVLFSKETTLRERALLPKGVLFRSLTLAGAD